VLDQVAASVRRTYPGQLIGIEGHTDADPIRKSNWKDNHELSYQRGKAVFDYLSTKGGIPANQLYVAAYGPNHPVASNGSSSGKAQNRRVEFVVRPDEGVGRQ
jgi:chemotaxis protein MotB